MNDEKVVMIGDANRGEGNHTTPILDEDERTWEEFLAIYEVHEERYI
jgi:hypothetical protein